MPRPVVQITLSGDPTEMTTAMVGHLACRHVGDPAEVHVVTERPRRRRFALATHYPVSEAALYTLRAVYGPDAVKVIA